MGILRRTVLRHINRLCKRHGVNSRNALIAKMEAEISDQRSAVNMMATLADS